jgi:hypothetical protein
MGYLDNSTITVDAILTKKGRELLAMGRGNPGGFQITQFALADDEVDYGLWNSAHPLGSAYYGAVIENMPVTEAIPDETNTMKYMLITMPQGQTYMPYLQAEKNSISLQTYFKIGDRPAVGDEYTLRVYTSHYGLTGNPTNNLNNYGPFNKEGGYTITLVDNTFIDFVNGNDTMPVGNQPPMSNQPITSKIVSWGPVNGLQAETSTISIAFKTLPRLYESEPVGTVKTTKIIIRGNETGGRIVVPITATVIAR